MTHPSTAASAPLAVVTRGDTVESVHFGAVAVVTADGRLVASAGDPQAMTFTRSALKPLQAIPFVRDGGVERFGYGAAHVALLCASHAGEPRHVDGVAEMLGRAGNTVDELACGAHAPGFYDVRGVPPPPPPYSPLAHNCSGKHAGMLACCAMQGWSKGDYVAFEHPLQREIRAAVAGFSGVGEDRLAAGIDGCSAPNYAMPLAGLATAFARLAVAEGNHAQFGRAPATLRDAMVAHPEMVSGEGRSDLLLARAGNGDWIAKTGAEGVQAIGVRSRGLGIAIKVGDGGRRALLPAAVAVLGQLGLLDDARRAALSGAREAPVFNYRGTPTGVVRPVVTLAPAGVALDSL